MSMHRTNKSRRNKHIWTVDPITGKKKVIPLSENMPWHSGNVKRQRKRNKIAKLARRKNR